MEKIRQIIFYKDYFLDFYNGQTDKVKGKVEHVLFVISVAGRIPARFFQHLADTDGLYEIRVDYQGNIFRIFSCFDEGKLVVLFNGFQRNHKRHRLWNFGKR